MITSDRSKILKDWCELVGKFFEVRIYGNIAKVNFILENMEDFILGNKENFAKETFLRAERAIEEVFFFLNMDETKKRGRAVCSFQVALSCIYRRKFFSQLLD
ncbi:MAG: hypothetical protein A2561_02840 [Candidatus Staskawiczbacteria bacterium RIFOXYD1_FULL_32_13]|uniref:Uncharacterized protein n=1 Tax=Candidatus Staskawiczbacteria bacterium RIFOXYD1_FULL_32_13 TaxID=1802234 RepID=A0A1G2JNH5_9BACT|nr:MAG: hypothetical protein UR22_C0006G0027 [Parcubacteria group bacterium GW2011_GWC2_32_10]OGZ79730.1 MAG: hypothetical protein A2256_01260 [Candidatus Staskawiczbacteria bacterium RIFOXYA2_FULL_32_7]OGZ85851.1 MAG: hypothetical protein A2463_03150 [Candidatus Staskawiczbacteria bacterium RIFOXYC2_FULL_32_10]OGZ88001.1 MAG: hypothetical protein A2561_02840 [Candidatus Staskawiczbacteria bacterium RIFOXYD1_FULL_32_13]